MNIIQNPTVQIGLVIYVGLMIASAVVQSLPTPAEIPGVWYKAFYNFLSILVTDFKSFAAKYPVVPQFSEVTTKTIKTPEGSSSSTIAETSSSSSTGAGDISNKDILVAGYIPSTHGVNATNYTDGKGI